MTAMTATINPKTGLKETVHDYYKLPIVHQKGLGRLRLDGQLSAVNFVCYAQNASDLVQVNNHLTPFKEACGIKSQEPVFTGRKRAFTTYDGEFTGHGKITSREFDHHFQEALAMWRTYRER